MRVGELGAVCMLFAVATAEAAKPPLCTTGRFLVPARNPPLFTGATLAGEVVLTPGPPAMVAIRGNCPAVRARLKATRRGTVLQARWPFGACGVTGKVRLTATIVDLCQTLTGTLKRSKTLPAVFVAPHCALDGVVSAVDGEECDGDAGCPDGLVCTTDCRCVERAPLPTVTTTTRTTTTRATTSTTTASTSSTAAPITTTSSTTSSTAAAPTTTTTTTSTTSSTDVSSTTTTTTSVTTTTDCAALCGNGTRDTGCGEECDGDDLGGAMCPEGSGSGAFPEGCPRCLPGCVLDTTCCTVSTTTATTSTTTATSTTTRANTTSTTTTIAATSFSRQVQPILTANCLGIGCHSGGVPAQGLDLTAGRSYAELLGTTSVEFGCAGLRLVAPGSPDTSVLVKKLVGTACGFSQMPFGRPPLPANQIKIITTWIAQGALDN